ncbi:nucleotidyltransferase domain-containing protein [Pseudarthrobacter oxydans]|uniref:nucleotidyltransferase domain-containing protein n=1 Tax=Pseudarthrobacter oxydans TaxID=1671 RepID=UPI003812E0F6
MVTTVEEHRAWEAQGSVDASSRTYTSVKTALDRSAELRRLQYEVFLQGSYANATNTRGDSDVDVVVMLTSTYMPETSRLSGGEQQKYASDRIPGTTSSVDFRSLVEQALRNYYDTGLVDPKNKCIKVKKRDGYVDADVVPAMQQRLFTRYPSLDGATYVEGISITPLQGARLVNYPKEQIKNGQAKNAQADGNYKATVRQVKRLRRKAVSLGLLGADVAPGYLLECLISNVPDELFVNNPSERLLKVMAYLQNFTSSGLHEAMWSADRIHKLFVSDPGGHSPYMAEHILNVLWDLL